MAGSYKLQDDYIIGGGASTVLTPNFQLKEFTHPDGTIHVHRELVAGLQIMRDNLGEPIRIINLADPTLNSVATAGLGITVAAADPESMQRAVDKLVRQGYFTVGKRLGTDFYLEIPDPNRLPAIAAKSAFDCGMQVTAAFETRGDPYLQVTGNFDGAGLSFGPIQCNLGSGTLQELFRRMRGENERLLQDCFITTEEYRTFWKILDGSRKQAVLWADQLSTGSGKQGFSQPWKSHLEAVGQKPLFRKVMLRYAYDKYGKLLMSTLAFLKGVSPIEITNLRCLTALYDMGVQQGSLNKAYTSIQKRVTAEQPSEEFTLTRIAVEERANKASPKWRADCLSRRLSILERRPVAVTIEGQRARRSNSKTYLLRNSPVKGLEKYLVG
ncbi:MAG: hypothetical protein GY753_14185 [Gammaproteobacteria bacterium]|nr:hypothetical protein [Gammaproteobacteria bacterium]